MRRCFITLLMCLTIQAVSRAEIGDTFKANTVEGVEMAFHIIGIDEVEVMCLDAYYETAIDGETEGAVTIPNEINGYRVTRIGMHAFKGCSKVTSFDLPNSIEAIDEYAFAECRGITSIIIPECIREIGDCAFIGCDGLRFIYVEAPKPYEIPSSVFITYTSSKFHPYLYAMVYVPKGSASLYKETSGWNRFRHIIEMEPTGIKSCMPSDECPHEILRFTIDGQRAERRSKGIDVMRMSDGSIRKIINRK